MTATEQTRLVGTVTNERNQPMLGGLFTPLATESEDIELPVTGNLPAGLNGMYIRNGPNPMFEPRGGYHMFDGDAFWKEQIRIYAETVGQHLPVLVLIGFIH